ncbi:MAG: hypothetical protein FJX74_13485 [Armatimonadetes bacterium]|nr:hypothetical protein [Armatimonadota bacterium]
MVGYRRLALRWLSVLPALAPLMGRGQPAAPPEDPVLVEGRPPLLQSDVEAWSRLVEAAFDAPVAAAERAQLQEALVSAWQAGNGPARSQLAQAKAAWERLGSARGAEGDTLRLTLREELLEAAGQDPDDPVGQVLLRLRDAASPVLVDAEPPLRRGSALALVGLFEWLATRAGGGAEGLTDFERDQFVAHLVQHYPHIPPGDRMLLEHMEQTFAWLRLQWEQAGPEGQSRFRDNLARALGVEGTLPPAPYAGATDTWEHPDGLFNVDYPAEWAARYAGLPDGTLAAGWELLDVTLLGEAPSAALELGALPEEGALLATAILPPEALADRMTVEEAVVALAQSLLSPFGAVEPIAQPTVGKGAVLGTWTQHCADGERLVWLSAVLLPRPPGAAVVTLCRAPAARRSDLEPALSRILYSLRTSDASAAPLPDLLELPTSRDLALDLLNTPFPNQMDMIEGLSSGGR